MMAMMMTIATFHLLTKEALFSLKFLARMALLSLIIAN